MPEDLLATADAGQRRRPADAHFAFSNEIVTSQQVIFSLGVTYPDPLYEGRIHEAS